MVIVPIMVAYFAWVKRHYDMVRAELALPDDELADLNWQAYNRLHNHVIVLVKDIDRRLVRALQYAKTLRADTTEALYIDVTGEQAEEFRARGTRPRWASGSTSSSRRTARSSRRSSTTCATSRARPRTTSSP